MMICYILLLIFGPGRVGLGKSTGVANDSDTNDTV